MRQNHYPAGMIIRVVFLALILTLFIGNAMASECVRCHTRKEKLKAITDTLPKKVRSTEISGKG